MSRLPAGLLLDTVFDNTGDKAIRIVMEEFFQRNSIDYEVADPLGFDQRQYGRMVVGGGYLIRDPDGGYYDVFRVQGPHVLNAMGVMAERELEYLREYEFVTVRSRGDQQRLTAAGVHSAVVPCPTISMNGSSAEAGAVRGRLGVHFAPAVVDACPDIETTLHAVDLPMVFIPFTHYARDREAMAPVAARMRDSIILDFLDPQPLFSIIGGLKCLVTCSLHACIFAYANNIPFLAFRIPKVAEFCADRGLDEWLFSNQNELELGLDALLSKPVDYSHLLENDRQEIKQHFQHLADLLKPYSFPTVSEVEQNVAAAAALPLAATEDATAPTTLMDRINALHGRLRGRDFAVARRSREYEERLDAAVGKLSELQERVKQAEDALQITSEELQITSEELANIRLGPGYQALEGLRRLGDRMAPWGTLRSRLLATTVRGLAYFLNLGPRAFVLRLLQPREWLPRMGGVDEARHSQPLSLRGRALDVLKQHGPREVVARSFDYLRTAQEPPIDAVSYALSMDWRNQESPRVISKQPLDLGHLTINWVVPTVGEGGGYRNIFRFIEFFSKKGHSSSVYEMPIGTPSRSVSETKRIIQTLYGASSFELSHEFENMRPSDITFATSWHTAYPVVKFAETRKKFYLVQDFEAFFAPVSTESIVAENTYRFGFYGVTAGPWLSEKLSSEYDMKCMYFNMAADHHVYFPASASRSKIFFYAMPSTPRRGFELGIKALEIFHSRNPEYSIVLAGKSIDGLKIGFPTTNVGYMSEPELNELYNQCAAALIVSLTNCSLLPFDIMATGCPVVITAGKHNSMLLPPNSATFVVPSPHHLAAALEEAVRNPPSREAIRSRMTPARWDDELAKIEELVRRELAEFA